MYRISASDRRPLKLVAKALATRLLVAASLCAAALSQSPTEATAQERTRICFVYIGSRTDGGLTQSHDRGRQQLQAHFGDRIDTPFLEKVPEGPDAERAIEDLARSGCALIFSTPFGFQEPMLKVAEKFPNVKFEQATGQKTAANVATYNARFYEGRYILGKIAARVSKNHRAGYLASFPVPEVVMGINAFVLGAKSVDPNFKVKVSWVNTWFDPRKEAEATRALIDDGIDVITQHTDSTAPMQVAQDRGVKAFGQTFDTIAVGPTAQLTAIVHNWGAYYIRRTQELLDGNWKPGQHWEGLKEGMVAMAPMTNMPDDVKVMAEETAAKIRAGEIHPFTGPINRQDGSAWLKAGERADDATLLGMDFYVEGVDDKLPQ